MQDKCEVQEKPLVSVIVPVYNSELYLKNCLTSIAGQTYKNLEIICVNDGSTDTSAEILSNFEKSDPRFCIVTQSKDGVSAARNRGMELAQGEYITFVDSDDDIDLSMVEILVGLAKQYHADIVHCGYRRIQLDGSEKDICGTKCLLVQNNVESGKCLIEGKYFAGGVHAKLYRKKNIIDVKFDHNLKINEDVLFNFEAFIKTNRTVFVDVPLYHYYERENSSCKRTNRLKKSLDCLQAAERIYHACAAAELEQCAAVKLFYNLMRTYKVYLLCGIIESRQERKLLAGRMDTILKNYDGVSQKYKCNYCFMRSCPYIYKVLYRVYDKIRKPNWDI